MKITKNTMRNGHIYLIIHTEFCGSGSIKTNALLNLIKEQDYHDVIDKIYLYAKDLSEPKYEYLTEKREDAGIKNVNNPSAFTVCSDTMDDVYEDVDNYKPKRNKSLNCFW